MLAAHARSEDTRTLDCWLRFLWARAPALHRDSAQVYIAEGAIHLPAQGSWREHRAAAAHAAAHLVFSPGRFEGPGLGVLVRALVGLLEDARVEALAGRELPGLLRLWQQQHVVTPAAGAGLPALMRRLARALADPGYADPHPWVAKGRRLCFLDPAQALLALRTPADVVQAARLLGHDIGQQRLAFDAQVALPLLAYRDDHRWMWPAERPPEPVQPPPQPLPGPSADRVDDTPADFAESPANVLAMLPEWDRLIGRLRPRWCSLRETPAATAGAGTGAGAGAEAPPATPLRLRLNVRRLVGRSRQGTEWELDALVQARLALRRGGAFDSTVYRDWRPSAAAARVWLLLDQSASSAEPAGPGGETLLERSASAAWSLLLALQKLGVPCALAAFRSRGRHAVEWTTLKRFEDSAGPAAAHRLRALEPGGSTRIGAIVRHAAGTWAGTARGVRWLVLFSDGEPHDVDLHDPRYLVEDARHAVRAARGHAVRTLCLSPRDDLSEPARRIFGAGRGAAAAPTPQALRLALRRWRP